MRRTPSRRRRGAAIVVALFLSACAVSDMAPPRTCPHDPGAIGRGAYLATAGNCIGCHTDREHHGAVLAGGRAIKTEFGTYYSSNITPDVASGIGSWSDADFVRALRYGIARDGTSLFPAFPFPSFTQMSDRDLVDLKAYLDAQPPIAGVRNKPPDARFPFATRAAMTMWRLLYLRPGPLAPDPHRSAEWNRGAYLANAVAHCGECHTPRTELGALDNDRRFTGARSEVDNLAAPDITADRAHGIGAWSTDDIAEVLKSGMTPQGDFVGGTMAEVVEGTAKLSDADRRAIAVYLKTVSRPGPTVSGGS